MVKNNIRTEYDRNDFYGEIKNYHAVRNKKNFTQVVLFVFILLIITFNFTMGWCENNNLEYIVEQNDFVDGWELTPSTDIENVTVTEDSTVVEIYDTEWHSMELKDYVISFTREERLQLLVKVDLTTLTDDNVLDFGFFGQSSYTEETWFTPSEIDITQSSSADWITLISTPRSGIVGDSGNINFRIYFKVRITPETNPVVIYIKNLSSSVEVTLGEPIVRKGICENCEHSYECEEGLECQGYTTADDPFGFSFGKCIPIGSDDPCDVLDDSSGGQCFVNSTRNNKNSMIKRIQKQ